MRRFRALSCIYPCGSARNAKPRALSHNFPYRSALSFNLRLGSLSESLTSAALSDIRIILTLFFSPFFNLLLHRILNRLAAP